MANTSTEQIVYDEATRAVSRQEDSLDGLRARTGTLLAAAALITAFLGSAALARDPAHIDKIEWSAIGAFVGVAFLALVVLWPWTWYFAIGARVLFHDHVDVPDRNSPAKLHRFLAERYDRNWDRNQVQLGRLFWCFRAASLCLVVEVCVWLFALGKG